MNKKLIVGAVLCSAIPAFAGVNLVTDGSFESASVAAGTDAMYGGSSLDGWTALPGDLIEVRNDLVGTAQNGNNFVELDSTHNSSMLTTLATDPGKTYSLSFWYSGRPDSKTDNTSFKSGKVPASSDGLGVNFGDGMIRLHSPTDPTSDNIWQEFTTLFTATGTSTTLMFSAMGKSDSFGSSLDDISVVEAAIPEPGTFAMMGAGLLGLLGLGLRRSRNR